jgi:hypothetical protein
MEQVRSHWRGLPEDCAIDPPSQQMLWVHCLLFAYPWCGRCWVMLPSSSLPACECALQAPEQQATVEVACALEGLAHCLQASLADAAAAAPAIQQEEEQERKRLQLYAECATSACRFLLEAQVGELGGGEIGPISAS